jgi:uncharacterized protein (TIGR00251 family)
LDHDRPDAGLNRPGFFRADDLGVTLFVRLTPKSSRDAIEGEETMDDGRVYLKARVRAVPEDGKANAALEKLVAKWLELAARDVTIAAGTASRLKQIRVSGDPEALAIKLSALVSPDR